MRKSSVAALLALLVACLAPTLPALAVDAAQEPPLLVFGAASLTNVLDEIGAAYTKQTGQPVKFSYAASSVLARQIEAGSRVDVFFSADTEWMDYLQARNLIDKSTRRNLLGNRLVLVAPVNSTVQVKIAPDFPLARILGQGRLATGDPDSVPVGRYARSALTSLGVWNDVADKLVRAENVRSALAFVSRGEAPLGIVYETDAFVDKKVRIVAVFPPNSHLPIVYPVAVTTNAQVGAKELVTFMSSAAGVALFEKYGFPVLP